MSNGCETVLTYETMDDERVAVVEYWDVYRQQLMRARTLDAIPARALAALPHDEREAIRQHLPAHHDDTLIGPHDGVTEYADCMDCGVRLDPCSDSAPADWDGSCWACGAPADRVGLRRTDE